MCSEYPTYNQPPNISELQLLFKGSQPEKMYELKFYGGLDWA